MITRSFIAAFGRTTSTASSLLTGLKGYWKLDDAGGGGTAIDSTAFGNTGTVSGTTSVAGKVGTALSFNSNFIDNIQFSDNAAFHVGDVGSWSFWVKRTRTNITEELISFDSGGWEILFYASGPQVNGIQLVKSGVSLIANSTIGITDTSFHHVVVTKNGAAVFIYIDGSDVTSAITNATLVDPNTAWRLGATTANTAPFAGTLDEVGLWNRAITPGEVSLLYNSGSGITHPF